MITGTVKSDEGRIRLKVKGRGPDSGRMTTAQRCTRGDQ